MLTMLLLATVGTLLLIGLAPFVWWGFVLCGPKVVNLGTGDGDTTVLVEPDVDVIVEVDCQEP